MKSTEKMHTPDSAESAPRPSGPLRRVGLDGRVETGSEIYRLGSALLDAQRLCRNDGASFTTWVSVHASMSRAHAYKLIRFANRLDSMRDEKRQSLLMAAWGSGLWALMTASDAVLDDAIALAAQLGRSVTAAEVVAMKARHNPTKEDSNALSRKKKEEQNLAAASVQCLASAGLEG